MFVDIEGCTRLCEDLPPAETTHVIETYFARYLDIIREEGGEVSEVLGDGLLAVFERSSLEASTHGAIRAALRIRECSRELNAREHELHDSIVVNIGLNAGAAAVGITRRRGDSGERWFYSPTGPVTNIAARLCALALRGQILVSGAVADLAAGSYQLRALGRQVLKNVSQPVEVFEIVSGESASESDPVKTRGR